jgi:hypothetical protein
LSDTLGRVGTDLRVSVTEHSHLRCAHGIRHRGLPWMPGPKMLSDNELLRIIVVFIGLGCPRCDSPVASHCCVDLLLRWWRASRRISPGR